MVTRRVDGIDAAFLAAETDQWLFHVSALQIVDPTRVPGFGFEAFRDLVRRRIHLVPQLRWRLVPPPLGLGWSYFVDDPRFVLDDHVHEVALPAPGGREELGRLVGDLISTRIDRMRPLWEMWFVEGLPRGRVALLTKIHHSIVDGVSGIELYEALFDAGPVPRGVDEAPPFAPEPVPAPVEIAARNAVHAVGTPVRMARLGRGLVGQGLAAAGMVLGAHAPVLPFQAPRSAFNGLLTGRRSFASASLPMSVARAVKAAAGVTLNDVLLTVCAGALRGELGARDELPDAPLVAQVPVSTRTAASRGSAGTQVGSMFVSLATDVADPRRRLRAVHASSVAAKRLRARMGVRRSIGISEALPPALFTVGARAWAAAHLDAHMPPIYNVVVSNVAGPPYDFHVAGARIEAMFPFGPLLYGGGLNISVVGHGDRLDVGVLTCRDLVADPWPLADRFGPALDELADAVLHAAGTRRLAS